MDDFTEIKTPMIMENKKRKKDSIQQKELEKHFNYMNGLVRSIQAKISEGVHALIHPDYDVLVGDIGAICDKSACLSCEAAEMLQIVQDEISAPTLVYEKLKSMIGDVKISYTEERWLKVIMGELLPHKKNTKLKPLLYQTMYTAIYQFIKDEGLVVYDNAVIIIRNIYDQKKKYFIRDNDNIEVSVIINSLGSYFLPDDAGQYCDLFMCSDFRDYNGTEIFLVPRSGLLQWLGKECAVKGT